MNIVFALDVEAMKNLLLTIPGWAVVGFVGKHLYTYWENLKTSRELVEYHFNASNVREKRRFFIETNGQSLPPSVENEMKSGTRNIVSEELIPFFITNAFKKKEKDKFYLVLGDSGMGKTTFMINLYLRYNSWFNVNRKYRMRLLPFGDKGVLEKIKEIKEKADASKTILLLDAFDEYHKLLPPEIPDGLTDDERFRKVLHEVIEAVQDFREVVFTSRTQYFPNQENQIYKLEIRRPGDDGVHELVKHYLSPFSEDDIKRYLNKKYGRIPFWNYSKKQVAVEIVRKAPDMMARPMLLSYIDVFADGTAEYSNTYQIYEALVSGWIDREGKKREHENRDTEEFKRKLREYSSKVALRLYERRKEVPSYTLSRSEATDIDAGLKEYQITGQSLLTRDAHHQWKFAHRSILEFFLAKEAFDKPDFAQKLLLDLAGLTMAKKFCNENGVLLRLNFVLIKGDTFMMGSPDGETGHGADETQHEVTLSDYYICKYAVTVVEFRAFIDGSGYKTDAEKGDGSYVWNGKEANKKAGINWRYGVNGQLRPASEDNHPVLYVSWNDAKAYCDWLSEKSGKQYRLPTEAQWEYACRAGDPTSTPFNTGENLTTDQANYNGNYPYNGHDNGEYRQKTVPVDHFAPNAWGLYNMHGNVWEWCSNWYSDNYYEECKAKGVVENPENTAKGSNRVLRGGSWNLYAGCCRSADRGHGTPDNRGGNIGFRLVFVP